MIIGPQKGPQEKFLSTRADIAFYGGAAGGGKSYALLLEPVRHCGIKGYSAVIFRKTSGEITNAGGLWDTSEEIYPYLGAEPRISSRDWTFPAGANVAFSHFQQDKNKLTWQGSQICFIGWDEVTHFSEEIFFYMLSRNRSMCGVRPYVRATCNPDPDSWVRQFISWWIDEETGLPIPERDGVIRWFARKLGVIHWFDSFEEAAEYFGSRKKARKKVKSVTFIRSMLEDNQMLMEKDTGYEASLESLTLVDRERLRGGNWNIRPVAGMCFKKTWFKIVDAHEKPMRWVRAWDRAATPVTERSKDPDWTAGVKMGIMADGRFVISDIVRLRGTPLENKNTIKNIASQDGTECTIVLQQDPGSAGIYEISDLVKALAGFIVRPDKVEKSKYTRAKPLASHAEAGNVLLVRGKWNKAFLEEAESFVDEKTVDTPPGYHDDQVDSAASAFNTLSAAPTPQVR